MTSSVYEKSTHAKTRAHMCNGRMETSNNRSILAKNFMIELRNERASFVLFYKHIQKKMCVEVLHFFLGAYHYRNQHYGVRMLNEKAIYNHFISRQGKMQVNLADKLNKQVCSPLCQFNASDRAESWERACWNLWWGHVPLCRVFGD